MKKDIVMQPEGNFYDKYHTGNPISRRLMKNFFTCMEQMMGRLESPPAAVLEAGCGEGHVINHINQFWKQRIPGNNMKLVAFDISEDVIERAKQDYPEVEFSVGSIYEITSGDYDLVIASEVLEHMEEPEKALEQIVSASNKYILLSVPNEPIWRVLNMARGAYWNAFGNTPGHIQHWNRSNFRKMLLSHGIEVIEEKTPLPWLMFLCKKKGT